MKKFISIIFLLLLILQLPANAKTYPDVSKTHPYYEAIDSITETGIISGYADGRYYPNQSLLRSEMAILLYRCFTVPSNTDTISNPFLDVDKYSWYYDYVMNCYLNGIIELDNSKKFRPEEYVKFGEAVQFVVNACSLKQAALESGGFPKGYTAVAKQKGLIEKLETKEINSGLNRGELAQLFYNCIKAGYQAPELKIELVGNGDLFHNFLNSKSVSLKVNSKSSKEVLFIISYYDKTGALLEITRKASSVRTGTNDITITLPTLQDKSTAAKIKVMVWNNTHNMEPLCNSITLDSQDM